MVDPTKIDTLLQKANDLARTRLSEARYDHTLRVTDCAKLLAKTHGLDPHRVRLSALLHDAARELKKGEFLQLADEWSLPVGEPEQENPKLLHGPVAAELARRELGVEDPKVLEAVRVHTTAETGMGPIALAVYVADKIEPARDYPSVKKIRKLARKDLRRAAAESLRRALAHNRERSRPTHPASIEALDWLEQS